jgi:hypothetical protein
MTEYEHRVNKFKEIFEDSSNIKAIIIFGNTSKVFLYRLVTV